LETPKENSQKCNSYNEVLFLKIAPKSQEEFNNSEITIFSHKVLTLSLTTLKWASPHYFQ
jgi:hypothetical protein